MRWPGSTTVTAADVLERVHHAGRLAESGRFAALATYLDGIEDEVRTSPTLAFLRGLAHARLGRHAEGGRWVAAALELALARGDRTVEVRALNALGAIAWEQGAIETATDHFRHALAEAERAGDLATVGRCSVNLGIIANLRGEYERAVGAYTLAMAAFQRAAFAWGLVVAHHNLGITYRDQGDLVRARDMADRAVESAARAGDLALGAQVAAGRAEVRVAAGAPVAARVEAERALGMHERLGDVVGAAEDRRILAAALAALGDAAGAERLLGTAAEAAERHGRPLLAAAARRDLAALLAAAGRRDEAADAAHAARVAFSGLGAAAEVRKLDALLARL